MKQFRTSPNGGALEARPHHAASNGLQPFGHSAQGPTPLDAATLGDLATRLGLTKRDGDTWRGPNPFTGEGSDKRDSDRFVLFPEGNGAERGGQSYTRREVFERAGMMLDAATGNGAAPHTRRGGSSRHGAS